jgi:hypothetical protein
MMWRTAMAAFEAGDNELLATYEEIKSKKYVGLSVLEGRNGGPLPPNTKFKQYPQTLI